MSPPLASYTFVPWLRRGAATQIVRADGAGPAAARASFPIDLSFNDGLSASVALSLYGPGDITGFDGRTVIRTWPRADVASAESNYFPLIEFDQADLPWRYSPARANASDRLRPWLCLIVLKEDEIERYEAAGPSPRLPVIKVKSATALPRLDQSWAWAHAQVSGVDAIDPVMMADLLANEPERVLARLLCPRRLEVKTAYRAFLVPTFERGRLAGLGQPIADDLDGLTPAWSADSEMIDLPVYYQWRFRTGIAGDFESLVRQLKARTLPASVGIRDMDVSRPDELNLPGIEAASRPLGLEGALKTKDTESTPWNTEERDRWIDAFKPLINRPAELLANGGGERAVAPPLYGQWHAARDRIAPGEPPPWFHKLNADPRLRVTAGLGTLVVQSQQQQLMAGAWSQVEGIRAVNDELRAAQLAREVASRIYERHLFPLDEELVVQLTEPVHSRVPTSPVTVRGKLSASWIADGALEPQWRRIARSRGPVGRRQGRPQRREPSKFLERMNRKNGLSAASPPPTPAGMATPLQTGASIFAKGETESLMKRQRSLLALSGAFVVAALWLFATTRVAAVALLLLALGFVAFAVRQIASRKADDAAAREALQQGKLTSDHIRRIPARPHFVPSDAPPVSSMIATTPVSGNAGERGQLGGGADSSSAARFREASEVMLDDFARRGDDDRAGGQVSITDLKERLRTTLDPKETIAASYRGRFRFGSAVVQGEDPLQPLMAAPQFPQPMYESLKNLSQDWLLPGLDKVPPNTVALVVTNQRFVEAYMVGLNQEAGRMLLAHGYPTELRATFFRQFWDPVGYVAPEGDADPETLQDILPIHTWRLSELGRNSSRSRGNHLVLLIRGELLRRYPNALVYAVEAVLGEEAGGVRKRALGNEERHPVFTGTFRPDVSFFGFELSVEQARGSQDPVAPQGWFFVLQEQPSEPRFGLDASTANAGAFLNSWSDLSWDHMAANADDLTAITYIDLESGFPDARGLEPPWGRNAAEMAKISLQKPARIAIHGSDMLLAL